MASNTRDHVTIAITTYKRPELLGSLLDVITERVREASETVEASILVVDNDPDESAHSVVDGHPGTRYVAERTPGIAAARQRALDEAPDNALMIYLDDDVIPDVSWIEPLIATWQETAATIVAGYVRYTFPESTDPWVAQGGFFRRDKRPTGTRLSAAAAGNMLLDVSAVRRLGVGFDASLGLSGGEDTLFTTQVSRAGGTIIWCQESVVDDFIPAARATRSFCTARARAHGSTAVLVSLRLARSHPGRAVVRIRCTLGGLLRVCWGFANHLIGQLSADVRRNANGFRVAARGWGMARAAIGLTTVEYRRASPKR